MFIFSILFLTGGCTQKDYTIHFKDEMVLDYGTKENTINLINKVGDVKITDKHIKDNTLTIDNFVVNCDKINTHALGSYEVTYETNAVKDRLFVKKVVIKDVSGPKIKFKKETLTLSLEEYAEYNFADFIEISDNFNKSEELIVSLNLENKVEAGKTYKVKVKAEDEAGNKTSKTFKLKIKEEKIPDEEADNNPVELPDDKPSDNPSAPQKPNDNPVIPDKPIYKPTPPIEPTQPIAPEKPKPANKDFLFSDGYTMENVFEACSAELFASGFAGNCQPIKDAQGLPIGMRLTYY